ncbi:mg596 protein [Tupanvirus deep ocean]|uniref:Mg596 protein n=2 Tax=Tupanvirus TaxID=2094720 RepID=A0AC62A823_9VIRU|nr:mg596 protein [Tupanvirus deep ocean]QKU33807.1 mg596 protein [Tupanvirus deep ocean]
MNNNKHLKPNLLDPIIEKKIIKTLKPPNHDYWAPAKSGVKSFFENYIKPNIGLVIFIIIIILFLIYRYRVIKKDREAKEIEKFYKNTYGIDINQENNDNQIKLQDPIHIKDSIPLDKNSQDYTNLLLYLYNQQKESSREPQLKKYNNKTMTNTKLAYPMYPYARGGSLAPANSR